jgi:hypothetical protein
MVDLIPIEACAELKLKLKLKLKLAWYSNRQASSGRRAAQITIKGVKRT